MYKTKEISKGTGLSFLLALTATLLNQVLPIEVIGSTILALILGIILNNIFTIPEGFNSGIQFTSKRILKLAIIFLGASLNIGLVLEVGSQAVLVLFFTLLTAFGGGYLLGKQFGVNKKLTSLLASASGICGGSAIAAVAPVIEADDVDISYAMTTTFLFDMVLVIIFPIIGRVLEVSDRVFGFWSGTAINDTSSVVAASFSFSEMAGEVATMVKLTRTLAIIPTVLFFTLLVLRRQAKQLTGEEASNKLSIGKIFPWFIVAFLAMTILNSIDIITPNLADWMRTISRFLMVMALAAVGLKTNLKDLKQTGYRPFIFGISLFTLLTIVSFFVTNWLI